VITAIGLARDPTINHFVETSRRLGSDVRLVDLDAVAGSRWELRLPPDERSWALGDDDRLMFDPDDAHYCRLIDLGSVDVERALEWRTLTAAVESWLELAPGAVVNRPGHVFDNSSKPLHEARIEALGLSVPPSVTSSSRAELLAFVESGKAIAKALSGTRGDCRQVTAEDLGDYEERSGPVHLQRFVPGYDVRAHVIGDRVIATRVRSSHADYRLDRDVEFEPWQLPDAVNARLHAATGEFGLLFAGWDLRVDDDDRHWVFEANPMPGYSYYDGQLGGEITEALLDCLKAA
jgi:hypothetical protein